jgi:hypothetical protein
MEKNDDVRGTLDEMIINKRGLYEGDLIKYFKVIFFKAQNLNLPYHNFRHMMHVTWLCYEACSFYSNILSNREMRNLLIAAMFHDFDHLGRLGNDDINIMIAIRGLQKHILTEDSPYINEIEDLIRATEYPYKKIEGKLSLCKQIIRDADLSQALNPTWLQQVVFGLAAEWKKLPFEVLKGQDTFQKNLKFYSDWAKTKWPQELINEKCEEAARLIQILED